MPNWCQNEVTIWTESDEARKKVLELFSSDRPFNAIVPRPKLIDSTASGVRMFMIDGKEVELTSWYRDRETGEERPFTEAEKSELREIGYDDWYMWAIYNWGTKWDIGPQKPVEEDDGRLKYEFNTAWSPPSPNVYRALVRMLKEIDSNAEVSWFYREDNCRVAGWLGD